MKIGVTCAIALAIGCEPEPVPEPPPPPRWAYAPPTPALPLGPVRGRLGRAQAPQLTPPLGITGFPRQPVRLVTPWQVPGDGPARVIAYGTVAGTQAVELVDIDHGSVMWRDTTVCIGPVVGVTDKVVVCAGAKGTQAILLDGKPAWRTDDSFVAMTDDRVVIASEGAASIRDAASGDEVAHVKLPTGVSPLAIIASCGDAGRELFAIGGDGKLQRIAEAAGGPKLVWAVPMGAVLSFEACRGDAIVAAGPGMAGTSLVSLARATGKITGRVDGVRGFWPARDDPDRIEIAAAGGVASWSRDLVNERPLALPALGELLAKRGDRRLVRATPFAAVVLDKAGVRGYVATSALGAALGDAAIVAASWTGSVGETIHRIAIPPPWHRELRDNAPKQGLALAAELRDLPASVAVDASTAITRADTAKHAVAAGAIEGDQLYVVPVEREPDDTNGGGVARIDLVEHGVRWLRPDGCGPGAPVAVAIAGDVVACGAKPPEPSSKARAIVRATTRGGAPSWDWQTDNIDGLAAAGDVVLAFDADRMVALDAADGHPLGTFASDDGAAMRATALVVDGTTWLVTCERGRVVARLPRVSLVAVWSIAVDGIVAGITPSSDAVVVALDDGDAYRIDIRTAAITAIPAVGLDWRASYELVTGSTAGGPLFGLAPPSPPPRPYLPPVGPPPTFAPPPFSVPIPTPPPIGASWQLAVYEATGAFRTRNDYALAPPIAPGRLRGAAGSPIVVGFGHHEALVIDPARGDPVRRAELPDDGIAFSTIVDGHPVAGIVLASPLRVVLF